MTKTLGRLRQLLSSLISDEEGSYVALTAFLLVGILGFAGMGIDLSMWYQEKRTSQNIADAAAVAAAQVSQRGGDLTEMAVAAMAEAVRNGFEAGPNNQLIVNASTGGPIGNATPIVDVEVRRAVPLFVMAVFKDEQQVVAAAATGGTQWLGNLCVIGLDHPYPGNATGKNVEFMGNTMADIECGVHSNSSSNDSIYVSGQATLMANPAQAVGEIMVSGTGTLIITGGAGSPIPYAHYMSDPMDYVVNPLTGRDFPDRDDIAAVPCEPGGSLVVGSDMTIGPTEPGGDYKICGDLTVKPGFTLTLETGVYYVEDGDILFQGIVAGDPVGGVTIVLTGTTPSNVGEIDIRAQASVTLTAPSAPGPYQGIAFMQDPDADTTGDNKFNGGANLFVKGYVYLKSQKLTYNGGSDVNGCTFIIARMINFSGNTSTYIKNTPSECDSIGIDTIPAQTQVVLVQ